jgi:23S rRNA-intervening sequence protein
MSDEIKAGNCKDLLVWQKGIALVKHIYTVTGHFPADEKYLLLKNSDE